MFLRKKGIISLIVLLTSMILVVVAGLLVSSPLKPLDNKDADFVETWLVNHGYFIIQKPCNDNNISKKDMTYCFTLWYFFINDTKTQKQIFRDGSVFYHGTDVYYTFNVDNYQYDIIGFLSSYEINKPT